jgi:hypothetical protein
VPKKRNSGEARKGGGDMRNEMKMVMVCYNEAVDAEVMEVLRACALKNYTKVMGVFGSGEASGIHLGNDIWPGKTIFFMLPAKIKTVLVFLPVSKSYGSRSAKKASRPLSFL